MLNFVPAVYLVQISTTGYILSFDDKNRIKLVSTNDMLISYSIGVTHQRTVARTDMCRQDGRGRFPVLLDDHSKCRTHSQRKSQLS